MIYCWLYSHCTKPDPLNHTRPTPHHTRPIKNHTRSTLNHTAPYYMYIWLCPHFTSVNTRHVHVHVDGKVGRPEGTPALGVRVYTCMCMSELCVALGTTWSSADVQLCLLLLTVSAAGVQCAEINTLTDILYDSEIRWWCNVSRQLLKANSTIFGKFEFQVNTVPWAVEDTALANKSFHCNAIWYLSSVAAALCCDDVIPAFRQIGELRKTDRRVRRYFPREIWCILPTCAIST